MLQHLDHGMTHDLNRILDAARAVLDEARNSYSNGKLTPGQIESVYHLRNDLGELLARFGDGRGYGTTSNTQLGAMRDYEEIANAWLAAVYATTTAIPRDEWERVRPGFYVVTRTHNTHGRTTFRRAECVNPAFALAAFDKLDIGAAWDER